MSSEYCTTRPGVGSMATSTRSIAAGGGCDSRSSSASVRSVRTSRIGAGSCRRARVDLPRHQPQRTCSTAAPRSRRSRCADSGSSSRVEDERQRLEPFDRPLELERCSNRSSAQRRHERRGILARARSLPGGRRRAQAAPRDPRAASAANSPERAQSPSARRAAPGSGRRARTPARASRSARRPARPVPAPPPPP